MKIDEEVISEIEKRRKLADQYYDNFRRYYENKNYSKASEFLWGSLNALAYAIGLLHGGKAERLWKSCEFYSLYSAHLDINPIFRTS